MRSDTETSKGDQKQTNVPKDVSRETLEQSPIYKKEQAKKQDLDKVRKKGNIVDDDPFDFNNPPLRELYKTFRSNGLSVIESGFNALYLWCYDNYYSSGVPIRQKYRNIYAHPLYWFKNTHGMWQHNKWSVAVRILEIVPSISRAAEKIKNSRKTFRENFWKTQTAVCSFPTQ